jgi:hypothetical protein
MTQWKLSGTVLIACNCDWGCPCNFNARPTQGHCEGGWTWIIDDGQYGDERLDGLAVSVFAKWPGAIHEGGGEAFAFVDEKADEAQREALARLVRGELGGPWGIFINTYTLDGPHPAAYRIDLAEHHSRLRIGDAVELEFEPMRNPVTDAEAFPEIVLPQGLVVKRAALASSRVFQVAGSFRYDYAGRYTAFGRFDYQGAAA